jgi:hypothetical protein
MKGFLTLILAVFLCLPAHRAYSQVAIDSVRFDTLVKKEKKGSIFSGRPGKSMLMSLVVPGTGQIYNKSYLRVPFVYAAVGGMGYVLFYNSRQYQCLKHAHMVRVDGGDYTPPDNCPKKLADQLELITDAPRLKLLRDQANQDRQRSIVIFSLVWLANGIDAFVDANLKDFYIDDNLSF